MRKWSSSLVLASQKVREGAAGGGLLDTCHNNINMFQRSRIVTSLTCASRAATLSRKAVSLSALVAGVSSGR